MLLEPVKVHHIASIEGDHLFLHRTNDPGGAVHTLFLVYDLIGELGGVAEDFFNFRCRISLGDLGGDDQSDRKIDWEFPFPAELREKNEPQNLFAALCDRLAPLHQQIDSFLPEEELTVRGAAVQRLWYFEGCFFFISRPSNGKKDLEHIKLKVEEFYHTHKDDYTKLIDKVTRLKSIASQQSKNDRNYIPDDVLAFVLRRDNEQCVKCSSKEFLQFDHILPVSKGGNSEEENLRVLCKACNLSRGNLRNVL